MRVLFLENNDSFSWNVIDALPVERHDVMVVPGSPPHAVSHQDSDTVITSPVSGRRDLASILHHFDCLIIGPGPTDPIRAGIVEIVRQAAEIKLPTLGICLGHQAIGLAFDAQLVRTHPVHGKRSEVRFSKSRLFPNTLGTYLVMRYHSLSLSDLKSPLRVVAQTTEAIPMAIEHESLPIAGLQFHPDSYATEHGREVLVDFFEAIR